MGPKSQANFNAFFTATGVSEQSLANAQHRFKRLSFAEGGVLIPQGSQQQYGYFLIDGILRACHFSEQGTERCKEFYFSGEFCLFYSSWLMQTSAKYQLEAITPAVVIRVPLHLLELDTWQPCQLALLKHQLLLKEQKEAFLLLNTPAQRYLYVMAHFPHWITSLSNIQLANYIGITPISLSRIRQRINKG